MAEQKEPLTYQELDDQIMEIVLGQKVISYKYLDYDLTTYLFRHPTGLEKIWSRSIEKESLQEGIGLGLPTEDNLPEELVEQYFTLEDQERLETLHNKSKAYKIMVKKGIKGSVSHDRNKEKLKDLEKDLQTLTNQKNLAKQLTANFRASEEKYYALMSKCVLNIDREPVWTSLRELGNETDSGYIETLLYEEFIPFLLGQETKVLRYIARSGLWRNRFHASKSVGVKLFSQNPEDYSTDQLAILLWSMFYYNIDQMAEEYKPEDHMISDDDLLDEYLEDLTTKIKAERYSRKRQKSKSKIKSSDSDNVIVTADNKEYISLHKDGVYSDPKDITGRAKSEKSTSYSESAQIKEAKRKNKARRKKRAA